MEGGSAVADLAVTLAPRGAAPGPSRQRSIFKRNIAEGHVFSLAGSAKGSLVVHAGCGDDYETTLTVIDRGGRFIVAGFAYDWDTRESRGTCEINLLTGRAVVSHGADEPKAFRAPIAPVNLADWSGDSLVTRCRGR